MLYSISSERLRKTRSKYVRLMLVGLLTACLMGVSGGVVAQSPYSLERMTNHLSERIPKLLDFFAIPGASVAIISNGEVVWVDYYGHADQEEERPVSEETLFRADSITKSVTAWAIMKLVERQQIDLNQPAEEYLSGWHFPETRFSEEAVTIRHLLSHSSGLTGGSERTLPGEERPPLIEVLEGQHGLHQARLVREPGSRFEYSNQGFIILEQLLQDVTGQDHVEYVLQEILAPLELREAYYSISEEVQERLAVSYDFDHQPVPMYRDRFSGASGLLITADELARFYAASMSGPEDERPGRGVLEPTTVAEMHEAQIEPTGFYSLGADGVGLGHFIDDLSDGTKGVFHGGEGAGSLGTAYIVPERGEGVVILTNSKRSWPFLFLVMSDWADLRGIPQPAMATVFRLFASAVVVLTGIVVLIALGRFYRLLRGIISQEKRFAPLANEKWILRATRGGLSVVVLIIWKLLGERLVSNLLPGIYDYLGVSLGILVLVTLVSEAFISRPSSLREDVS